MLRMIEAWVGEAAFQKGVNAYIDEAQVRQRARGGLLVAPLPRATGKPVDRGDADIRRSARRAAGHRVARAAARATARLRSRRRASRSTRPAARRRRRSGSCRCACAPAPTDADLRVARRRPRRTVTLHVVPGVDDAERRRPRLLPDAAGSLPALKAVEPNISQLTGPERLTLLADEWALVRCRPPRRRLLPRPGVRRSVGERKRAGARRLPGSLRTMDAVHHDDRDAAGVPAWVTRLLGPAADAIGWTRRERPAKTTTPCALRAALLRQLGGRRRRGRGRRRATAGRSGAAAAALGRSDAARRRGPRSPPRRVTPRCTTSTSRDPRRPSTRRIDIASSTGSPASPTRRSSAGRWSTRWGRRCARRTRSS